MRRSRTSGLDRDGRHRGSGERKRPLGQRFGVSSHPGYDGERDRCNYQMGLLLARSFPIMVGRYRADLGSFRARVNSAAYIYDLRKLLPG